MSSKFATAHTLVAAVRKFFLPRNPEGRQVGGAAEPLTGSYEWVLDHRPRAKSGLWEIGLNARSGNMANPDAPQLYTFGGRGQFRGYTVRWFASLEAAEAALKEAARIIDSAAAEEAAFLDSQRKESLAANIEHAKRHLRELEAELGPDKWSRLMAGGWKVENAFLKTFTRPFGEHGTHWRSWSRDGGTGEEFWRDNYQNPHPFGE